MTQPTNDNQQTQVMARCAVRTKQIRTGEDQVRVYHGSTYYVVCCEV